MLPYHHIFWKTPFETIRDLSNNENQKNHAKQAIIEFDKEVNRFDLPGKNGKDDTSCGEQGERAKVQAPYFKILEYVVKFLRVKKIKLQDINKGILQCQIGTLTKTGCPQEINEALKNLDDKTGKKFIQALRDHLLSLIPIMKPDEIPLGYNAMIDYRYKNVKNKKPNNPHLHFQRLRESIINLLNFK